MSVSGDLPHTELINIANLTLRHGGIEPVDGSLCSGRRCSTCVYVCMCVYRVYMCVCVYVFMCVRVYVCVCVRLCDLLGLSLQYICVYVCTCVHRV